MKMHLFVHDLLSAALFLFAAPTADASMLKHIIVIVMENKDAENSWGRNYIYGNTEETPYINKVLMPKAARAKNFMDQLPGLPSEPHYIWMEAGTNRFSNSDEFVGDKDVPAHRSTTSKYHLVAQIEAAKGPVPLTWMTYQEGISDATGKCPIEDSKADSYVVQHNPFVYFRDVSGDPPSRTSAYCVSLTQNPIRLSPTTLWRTTSRTMSSSRPISAMTCTMIAAGTESRTATTG
jgi:hypothetical protein